MSANAEKMFYNSSYMQLAVSERENANLSRKWLKIYSEAIKSRYVNKRDKPQMCLLHLASRKLKGKPMLMKRI